MRILDADALILHLEEWKLEESSDHFEQGDPSLEEDAGGEKWQYGSQ